MDQAFVQKLSDELTFCKKTTRYLSILVINMTCRGGGEQTRDSLEANAQLKKLLQSQLRSGDSVISLDQNRFGIILFGADGEDAKITAQLLLNKIAATVFSDDQTATDELTTVSVSIGFAGFPRDGTDAHLLLRMARVMADQNHLRAASKPESPMDRFRNSTKFSAPSIRQKLLPRRALVGALKGVRTKRFVFISAGPGFGKTVLLRQFHESVKSNPIWLRLSEEECDLYKFTGNLVTALKTRYHDFGVNTLSIIAERLGQAQISSSFILELESIAGGPHIFLIMDDFHLVSGRHEIVEFVGNLVEHKPRNLSLLLSSREKPPAIFSSYIINNDCLLIQENEMRLNLEETVDFARSVLRSPLPLSKIRKVWEHTRGWITGVQYALVMDLDATGSRSDLFNYLSDEIYGHCTDRCQALLLKLSFTPFFNEHLIALLLDSELDETIRSELLKLPFLEISTDGKTSNYSFPPLFLDYLRTKAQGALSDKEKHDVQKRLGRFFEENGDYCKAIDSFVDGRDFSNALRNIALVGPDIADASDYDTLRRWFEKIPQDALYRDPKILMLWALTEERRASIQSADQTLLAAEKVIKKIRKNRELNAGLLLTKAFLARRRGAVDKAALLAEQALRISRNPELKLHAYILMSLCCFARDEISRAIAISAKGLKIADRAMSRTSQYFLNNLGTQLLRQGNLNQARMYLERCVKESRNLNRIYGYTVALGNLSKTLILLGDFTKAGDYASEALALSKTYRFAALEIQNLNSLAAIDAVKGKIDEALLRFRQALTIAEETKNDYLMVVCALKTAQFFIKQKNTAAARQYLRKCEERISRSAMTYEHMQHQTLTALVQMDKGDLKSGLRMLQQSIRINKRLKTIEYEIRHDLVRYHYHRRTGSAEYLRFLRQGVKAIRKHGFEGLLIAEIMDDFEIINDLSSRTLPTNYFEHLVNRLKELRKDFFDSYMTQLSDDDRDKITSLVRGKMVGKAAVYMFGQGDLYINDRPVNDELWTRRKVRELFFLLILNSEGMTKEKIQSSFWPDTTATHADRNFWNTVYYLRKILDRTGFDDDIIIRHGCRLKINPRFDITVDTRSFETLIARARRMKDQKQFARAVEEYERAMQLCKDDLLETYYGEWFDEKRQYYRSLYAKSLADLGEVYYVLKDHQNAYRVYASLFSIDPLSEKSMTGMMECARGAGQLSDCLKKYRQYTQRLKETYNTTPSKQLQQLFQENSRYK